MSSTAARIRSRPPARTARERELDVAFDAAVDLAAAWVDLKSSSFTKDNYLRVISRYLRYCRDHLEIDPLDAREEDVVALFELARGGIRESTRNFETSTLSSFYRFAAERLRTTPGARAPRNPTMLLPRSPVGNPDLRPLSRVDAVRLLEAAHAQGPRPLALLSLFLLYGQPTTGVCQLRGQDIAVHATGASQLHTRGRRGRRSWVRLVPPAAGALVDLAGPDPDAPLFPGARTAVMERHACAREIALINQDAPHPVLDAATGTPLRITPRLLVTTFTFAAVQGGADYAQVMQTTGLDIDDLKTVEDLAAPSPAEVVLSYLTDTPLPATRAA